MKATFSPIVARPPFSLACALAEDKCYSDFIRVRVSVATLLASQLDFSGSYAKDYYFCEPCCICVYKTRYVPMKGSIRKSIVALLQRSFAVYRYVFAFILPCFAVGHCLEMDVSISLVVIVIIALILRLLYSSSRFFVDCPLFSFFFFIFLPGEGEIGK